MMFVLRLLCTFIVSTCFTHLQIFIVMYVYCVCYSHGPAWFLIISATDFNRPLNVLETSFSWDDDLSLHSTLFNSVSSLVKILRPILLSAYIYKLGILLKKCASWLAISIFDKQWKASVIFKQQVKLPVCCYLFSEFTYVVYSLSYCLTQASQSTHLVVHFCQTK